MCLCACAFFSSLHVCYCLHFYVNKFNFNRMRFIFLSKPNWFKWFHRIALRHASKSHCSHSIWSILLAYSISNFHFKITNFVWIWWNKTKMNPSLACSLWCSFAIGKLLRDREREKKSISKSIQCWMRSDSFKWSFFLLLLLLFLNAFGEIVFCSMYRFAITFDGG